MTLLNKEFYMIYRKISVLFLASAFLAFGCSAKKILTTQSPYSQASVVVHLKNGEKKQGIVLKREKNNLIYMDAKTHNKEKIDYATIQKLTEADVTYDFEANAIPNYVISEEKANTNTLLYGSGGLVLGTALGTAVGVALIGGGVELHPIYSMALFGISGAWYFGSLGSDYDYEDAIFDIRKERYKVSKAKRDKEIKEEKRKLEAQQKEKAELLRKIEQKKSKK
jgi:hypothetical protein